MECLGRYTFLVMTSVILSGGMKMRVGHGMQAGARTFGPQTHGEGVPWRTWSKTWPPEAYKSVKTWTPEAYNSVQTIPNCSSSSHTPRSQGSRHVKQNAKTT